MSGGSGRVAGSEGAGRSPALHAEPRLRARLAELDGGPPAAPGAGIEQDRADALLARIAWSRLAEPSDRVAGSLLASLGAECALELLVRGAGAERISVAAAEAGADLTPAAVGEALGRWAPRLDRAQTLADVDRGVATGLRAVLPGDPLWPAALHDLDAHAPIMLWVRGDAALLSAPGLGVVGARAATGYGTHVTAEIVGGLGGTGLSIVSGAAYGIDATAHRTALAAGTPTVAVVAGGVDRPYPAAHDALLARIGENGAVCSEMVPGSAPSKWRFLMRNRLIAALSRAVLVTEAGLRSGSLNTAGHAAELGRPVGAVPGPVTSPASAGCHRLIRDYGAALVTGARDVCELLGYDDRLELPVEVGAAGPSGGAGASGRGRSRTPPEHERVLDALPLRGGRALEETARRAGLGFAETRGILAELELLGRVRRCEAPHDPEPKWGLERAR